MLVKLHISHWLQHNPRHTGCIWSAFYAPPRTPLTTLVTVYRQYSRISQYCDIVHVYICRLTVHYAYAFSLHIRRLTSPLMLSTCDIALTHFFYSRYISLINRSANWASVSDASRQVSKRWVRAVQSTRKFKHELNYADFHARLSHVLSSCGKVNVASCNLASLGFFSAFLSFLTQFKVKKVKKANLYSALL